MSSCSSTTIVNQGGSTAITALHPDIIQTHILTRLDGPTLASTTCASSQLQALSTEEKLWKDICNSTWPSTDDPHIRDTISTFSSGYRSFFYDSFPTIHHNHGHRLLSQSNHRCPLTTLELISAIDIHYQSKPVFSKVRVIETETGWFLCSPFRIDLLDPKESVPISVKFEGDEDKFQSHLEEHMTLSWILIDPTRKRAVNLSSLKPVSVGRHWLTQEIQVRYAMIMAGDRRVGTSELVKCEVVVTCGGKEGGEMHMREVNMQVEDMDGKVLSGEDSLVILQEAMESGRRKKGNIGEEEKQRYEEYREMKRERRERNQRRERRLDMVCIATGISIFVAFWAFILLR